MRENEIEMLPRQLEYFHLGSVQVQIGTNANFWILNQIVFLEVSSILFTTYLFRGLESINVTPNNNIKACNEKIKNILLWPLLTGPPLIRKILTERSDFMTKFRSHHPHSAIEIKGGMDLLTLRFYSTNKWS